MINWGSFWLGICICSGGSVCIFVAFQESMQTSMGLWSIGIGTTISPFLEAFPYTLQQNFLLFWLNAPNQPTMIPHIIMLLHIFIILPLRYYFPAKFLILNKHIIIILITIPHSQFLIINKEFDNIKPAKPPIQE